MTTENTPPSLPVISTTDVDGVKWEYDPTDNRWVAFVDGKKTFSKEFETLKGKVAGLVADRQINARIKTLDTTSNKAPVLTPPKNEIRDVALMTVKFRGGLGNEPQFEPMIVRTEWNALTGAHALVRYKEMEGKTESGWRSWNQSALKFIHPKLLSDQERDFLQKVVLYRLMSQKVDQARHQLSEAWWSHKSMGQRVVEVFGEKVREMAEYNTMSRHHVALSPRWNNVSFPTQDQPTWTSQEDGAYRCGAVSITFGFSQYGNPEFRVFHDRWPDPIFKGDFKQALSIGRATVALNDNETGLLEWEYTQGWGTKKDKSKWPTPVRTYAAAVLMGTKQYDAGAQGYALCEFAPSPFGLSDSLKKDEPSVFWRTVRSGYSGTSFATAGPEDAHLEKIHALLASAVDDMQQRFICAAPNADIQPTFEAQLPEFTGLEACANHWEEEGEDAQLATTMKQITEQFNQVLGRIEQRIQATPEYVQWSVRFDEKVQQLVELVSQNTAAPRRSARPK